MFLLEAGNVITNTRGVLIFKEGKGRKKGRKEGKKQYPGLAPPPICFLNTSLTNARKSNNKRYTIGK